MVAAVVMVVAAVVAQGSRTARSLYDGGGVVPDRFNLLTSNGKPKSHRANASLARAMAPSKYRAVVIWLCGLAQAAHQANTRRWASRGRRAPSSFATRHHHSLTRLGWANNLDEQKPQSSASLQLKSRPQSSARCLAVPAAKPASCPSQRA